jgi:hypothetical protein
MRSYAKDRLSVRTVVVRYPDGEKEYWLTEQAFSVGDEIHGRDGRTLVVEEVLEPSQSGTYTTLRLTAA